MSKEMLPLFNKPFIQYGVEEAVDAGLHYIGFVSGRGKRAIEDHFDISCEFEHEISGSPKEAMLHQTRSVIEQCTFLYTRQTEMLGSGHAVLTGETLISNEPFAVLLADDFCSNGADSVLKQMVKLFDEYQCSIVAIDEVPADHEPGLGVLIKRNVKVRLLDFSDKLESSLNESEIVFIAVDTPPNEDGNADIRQYANLVTPRSRLRKIPRHPRKRAALIWDPLLAVTLYP